VTVGVGLLVRGYVTLWYRARDTNTAVAAPNNYTWTDCNWRFISQSHAAANLRPFPKGVGIFMSQPGINN